MRRSVPTRASCCRPGVAVPSRRGEADHRLESLRRPGPLRPWCASREDRSAARPRLPLHSPQRPARVAASHASLSPPLAPPTIPPHIPPFSCTLPHHTSSSSSTPSIPSSPPPPPHSSPIPNPNPPSFNISPPHTPPSPPPPPHPLSPPPPPAPAPSRPSPPPPPPAAGVFAADLEGVPGAAVGGEAVAARLAGVAVGREGVERVARVGHLRLPVAAPGRAEPRGRGPVAGLRRAFGQQRQPVFRAGAVAGGLAAVVVVEGVEGEAPGVDQDEAELGDAAERDEGALSGVQARRSSGRRWSRCRRRAARVAPSRPRRPIPAARPPAPARGESGSPRRLLALSSSSPLSRLRCSPPVTDRRDEGLAGEDDDRRQRQRVESRLSVRSLSSRRSGTGYHDRQRGIARAGTTNGPAGPLTYT